MEHHPVAHINSHMGYRAGAVIGSREKDNVAGLCLGGRNDSALVVNALRRGTGQVVDAAGRVHPADKARTVKDQREALMEKLKINAEQAKSVVKDNGSLDYDALGKITAEKETAAAQAIIRTAPCTTGKSDFITQFTI